MNGDEQRNKFDHSTFCWIFAVWWSVDTLFVQSQLFLRMNVLATKADLNFAPATALETAAVSFSLLVLLAIPLSFSG